LEAQLFAFLAKRLPSPLKRIIEDLQKPVARAEDFSSTVERALTEAQSLAGELKFVDAVKLLDAALEQTGAEDRDRARGRAALLAERGRIARLQLRYREAARFYVKAADGGRGPGRFLSFRSHDAVRVRSGHQGTMSTYSEPMTNFSGVRARPRAPVAAGSG
jgi:hypothetical protein